MQVMLLWILFTSLAQRHQMTVCRVFSCFYAFFCRICEDVVKLLRRSIQDPCKYMKHAKRTNAKIQTCTNRRKLMRSCFKICKCFFKDICTSIKYNIMKELHLLCFYLKTQCSDLGSGFLIYFYDCFYGWDILYAKLFLNFTVFQYRTPYWWL